MPHLGRDGLTAYPAPTTNQYNTTMKRVILTFALLSAIAGSMTAQSYTKDGNTFSAKAYNPADLGKGDKATIYTWKDSKGVEFPIFLHTYSKGEKAGRTTAYIIRTSAKGNVYRYYLPKGEEIAAEIMKEK